jgi:prevent-host-death family protein
MKIANIAEFKNKISEYLSAVEKGEEIEVRKRNIPIARVLPVPKEIQNRTVLGCGKGTGRIVGDITAPLMPEDNWKMLQDDPK